MENESGRSSAWRSRRDDENLCAQSVILSQQPMAQELLGHKGVGKIAQSAFVFAGIWPSSHSSNRLVGLNGQVETAICSGRVSGGGHGATGP